MIYVDRSNQRPCFGMGIFLAARIRLHQKISAGGRETEMNLYDFSFIFLFLPAFLLVYYGFPAKRRNTVLAIGSFLFYCINSWKRPWCIVLLLGVILLTWLGGIWLECATRRRGLHVLLCTALVGCLLCFKYTGIFGDSAALPLGISFYTFQIIAYLTQVAGGMEAVWSFPDYAALVLMFPKLLSGPLVPPGELKRQLAQRNSGMAEVDRGLRDLILGLALKVLLADRIGGLWRQVQILGFDSLSAPLAWMGIWAYSFQLLFDFAGYSRMAVGLGRMLGFRLPANFDHPYISRSMTEFWRRWHMTLGAWFRDYVYIPLGGSRAGTWKLLRNLLVVWLLTGIWHGNTWNFLLWGVCLFGVIANEKLWLGRILERNRIVSRVYMLLLIPLCWLVFAVPDPGQIGRYLTSLFSCSGGLGQGIRQALPYVKSYLPYFLTAGVLSCVWPERLWNRIRSSPLGTVLLLLLFWACVYCMSLRTGDPFLYGSF